jgi:hypothetical protein
MRRGADWSPEENHEIHENVKRLFADGGADGRGRRDLLVPQVEREIVGEEFEKLTQPYRLRCGRLRTML